MRFLSEFEIGRPESCAYSCVRDPEIMGSSQRDIEPAVFAGVEDLNQRIIGIALGSAGRGGYKTLGSIGVVVQCTQMTFTVVGVGHVVDLVENQDLY